MPHPRWESRRRHTRLAFWAATERRVAAVMAAHSGRSACRVVSDSNATVVSAPGRLGWLIMTALGSGDGSDQPGSGLRRARSTAWSRLSAMPWA